MPSDESAARTVNLLGMALLPVDTDGLLDVVFDALEEGRGGWVVTANLDFLRRHAKDHDARALYQQAEVRVADGMPLVWAARLQGDALPGRVAGASLLVPLAARAAQEGRSLFLLGGDNDDAAQAAALLQVHAPGLTVFTDNRRVAMPPSATELQELIQTLRSQRPDVVLVGLGSPKQEKLIALLKDALPTTWFVGVGISFSFTAGTVPRAPLIVQKAGLEWAHRLVTEPRRLWRRYLVEDLPFAAELFAGALVERVDRLRRR
jgi:N-acetylglucosaminyldiphosphoundecaprenol N-acetyl-beta-D-mannosaminyltransferase